MDAIGTVSFDSGDYDEYAIGDLCDSIPTKSYICSKVTENGTYPIIQQGEKPIVGYTTNAPFYGYDKVILFGDHTLSVFRPDTPFLLSTDGIKVLVPKPMIDRDFFFYLLNAYKPKPEGYKRHFGILKGIYVPVPNLQKQKSIATRLLYIDLKIDTETRLLKLLQSQKQYFLSQMFI